MDLGGGISPSIGKLSRLQRLALHQNRLHGLIPNDISKCVELRAVYLRANYLQGGIPSNIGNLTLLNILDLSRNTLTGAIPSSLGHLIHLKYLNLSTNFFSGEIPNFGALSRFGNNSYIGNLDLCGQQIHKPCKTSLGFPAVLPHAESDEAAGNAKTFISLFERRTDRWCFGLSGHASSLSFCLYVLEERKSCEEICSRTQLITFHGDLPYPSSEIIEKLESLDDEHVDQAFEQELEVLGSVKHINLVNLRGYCRFPDSKLLIYDYVANGSLENYLHDEEAHVTTVVAGTFGYLAPEYLQSGRATVKSDVYSFGVLLLELVTGKRPTDPAFVKRGLNVVGWVCISECTDADASTVEAILEIAGRCTDANPEDRPSMQQVLQFLEQEVMSPCPSDFYDSHSDYA
ncbi:LRR receptor-like serine/threonine-protein kinase FEI 1 [Tanacetum coccineum]